MCAFSKVPHTYGRGRCNMELSDVIQQKTEPTMNSPTFWKCCQQKGRRCKGRHPYRKIKCWHMQRLLLTRLSPTPNSYRSRRRRVLHLLHPPRTQGQPPLPLARNATRAWMDRMETTKFVSKKVFRPRLPTKKNWDLGCQQKKRIPTTLDFKKALKPRLSA